MVNTFTLLIWDNVCDETNMFLIPDESIGEYLRALLEASHNKYINSDDDEELFDLQYKLFELEMFDNENNSLGQSSADLREYKLKDNGNFINSHISKIYLTGCLP